MNSRSLVYSLSKSEESRFHANLFHSHSQYTFSVSTLPTNYVKNILFFVLDVIRYL